MEANRLLNALTDHMALYHRASISTENSVGDSTRTRVLSWLRTLSLEQRHAILTVSDRNWVEVLLHMHRKLKREGKGSFFLLTDFLDSETNRICTEGSLACSRLEQRKAKKVMADGNALSSAIKNASRLSDGLPGMCFRKAKGLLARLEEEELAGELLCHSLELFSSEDLTTCGLNPLDTISICKTLLEDMDQFIAIVDAISYGQFLSSMPMGGSSSWEETQWLKAMGYYTMPAFITNKLEFTLWAAWFQAEGSRRPPRNLSKEVRKAGRCIKPFSNGVHASAILQRTSGFFHWWRSLKEDEKSQALQYAVMQACKLEVLHSIRVPSTTLKSTQLRKGYGCTLSGYLSESDSGIGSRSNKIEAAFQPYIAGLRVLQKLAMPCLVETSGKCIIRAGHEQFFHCSLDSANTVLGRVMRRVRNALQKLMVNYMEEELLRGESCTNETSSKDLGTKAKKENRKKKLRNLTHGKGVSSTMIEVAQQSSCSSVDLVSSQGQTGNGSSMHSDNAQEHPGKRAKKKKHHRTKVKAEMETFPYSTRKQDSELVEENLKPQLEDAFSNRADKDLNESCTGCADSNEQVTQLLSDLGLVSLEEMENRNGLIETSTGCSMQVLSKGTSDFKCVDEGDTRKVISYAVSTGSSVNNSTESSCKSSALCTKEDEVFTFKNSNGAENCGFMVKNSECSFPPPVKNSCPFSKPSCASSIPQRAFTEGCRSQKSRALFGLASAHEWPGSFQVNFSVKRSHMMPPATERLHLDVGRNWQQCLQASLMTLRTPIFSSTGSNSFQGSFVSLDGSPLYTAGFSVTQKSSPHGFREDFGFLPFSQSPFYSPYAKVMDIPVAARSQEDSRYDEKTPNDTDCDDSNYFSGDLDDREGHLISEEEGDKQFTDLNFRCGEGDYNQYFGGGVMFWNTADYTGTGFSRPPSLSSEDSSWARHEADLSVVLDDIVGISPNMVNTSSPTVPYPVGFEHSNLSTATRVGMPIVASELPGKFSLLSPAVMASSDDEHAKCPKAMGVMDGIAGDVATRPVLRPIIVVCDNSLGRQIEGRSPCVPRKREVHCQRRPLSPVLKCVPPAPPPPPPSPVGGVGKRKGLSTVRSGSSSPRRWGLVTSCQREEQDKPFIIHGALEAVTNFPRSRNLTENSTMHPISGALLHERLFAIPSLALEQDHPDSALPIQTLLLSKSNPSLQSSLPRLHGLLQEEIETFCKEVAAENLLRKPFINAACDKVAHALQVLWPRSRLKIFGSNATGLALPCSDVDLVVCLPPVRNLEPIKEAGILEGRNGIKETSLQHAARYLTDQDWVKGDTLKTIENTAIPIIMLVAHVPPQACSVACNTDALNLSVEKESVNTGQRGPWGAKIDREFVRLDISFEAPSHTGIRTADLVRELTSQFPAIVPLALVLKQFLTDRSLDHPYTGGLSSYCLVLLITRFLQHQNHLGWPFKQNLGSLLMDFLHFFGCIFDPRRMGISIRGGGMYVNRDRGHSIDPLYVEDPLCSSNNVGRNCFRILQCVKAFGDAYSYLEKGLGEISEDTQKEECLKVLSKIIPTMICLDSLTSRSEI